MSKKRAGDSVADQIATFIGKTMGALLNKKEALQGQLTEVEKQIAAVRKRVLKQFSGAAKTGRKAKCAVKRAGKTIRRELSPATRRKMAIAAKKRWARVRKAAKNLTGA